MDIAESNQIPKAEESENDWLSKSLVPFFFSLAYRHEDEIEVDRGRDRKLIFNIRLSPSLGFADGRAALEAS